MPSKYDEETRAKAERLVVDHRIPGKIARRA